jgi:hypothetical protein
MVAGRSRLACTAIVRMMFQSERDALDAFRTDQRGGDLEEVHAASTFRPYACKWTSSSRSTVTTNSVYEVALPSPTKPFESPVVSVSRPETA